MKKIYFSIWLPLLMMCVSQVTWAQGLTLSSGKEFYDKCGSPTSETNIQRSVDKDGRFRMEAKKDNWAFYTGFQYPINELNDYSIEATVEPVNAKSNQSCGIIYGFKDWDNYSQFIINSMGHYYLAVKLNGINVYESKWQLADGIPTKKSVSRMKIWKTGDKIFYAVNGRLATSLDAYKLSGNLYGFITNGKGDFALHNFKIENGTTQTVSQVSNNKGSEDLEIVGSGTGFLIDKRGYLATNHHVVEDAEAIGVCLRIDGEWQSFNGEVIKDDPTNDLAIIKIDDPDFKGFDNLPYAFSFDTEDVASEIFTLGYPQVQIMGSDVKYTTGVINARTGLQGDPTHYQISAHIDHGNSGGPLFNEKGFIIGITDSGLNKAQFGDVNYAVKSTYLKVLADALPKTLEFANDKSIAEKKRTEQIRTLSQYVALLLIAK